MTRRLWFLLYILIAVVTIAAAQQEELPLLPMTHSNVMFNTMPPETAIAHCRYWGNSRDGYDVEVMLKFGSRILVRKKPALARPATRDEVRDACDRFVDKEAPAIMKKLGFTAKER